MNTLLQRLALTFATGSLIGAGFVVTKLLLNAGASPSAVAFVPIAGAGLFLLAALKLRGDALPYDRGTLLYYGVAALIAVASIPLLGNWVLARIPAGIFTVIVTLSPMFTALINAAVDRRLPAPHILAGAALGLAGVLLVLVPRAQAVDPEQALALLAALGVPVLLAIGNVYRSRRWPQGLGAPAASTGNLVAQAVLLAPVFAIQSSGGATTQGATLWPLFALLVATTIAANLAGATLQRVAGAAAYSQIGYVIALTGVGAGALLFGESLGVSFLPALALVFVGIVLTNRASAPRAVAVTLSVVAAR